MTSKPDIELVARPASDSGPAEAQRIEQPDDRPLLGSWWWVSDAATARGALDSDAEDSTDDDGHYDREGMRWLASVIRIGSNFAEMEGYARSCRIALDSFHARCTPEPNPSSFTQRKIGFHRERVAKLMEEIKTLCHRLGVPVHQMLGGDVAAVQDSGQALAVVHGMSDAKRYEKALIKAKEKTLPELFKQVEHEHELMAGWMKVEMIPARAELARAKGVTRVLEAKIHTVELYAGLTEELVQVRKGKPARGDDRVHLIQRRHYMDEECLARYEAGGMTFEHVEEFDRWLARDENMMRLFPFPRTIVAFRIRHYDRRSDDASIAAFINLYFENLAGKQTYLYIRNGHQLWRVETSVAFAEELFPHKDDHDLLSDVELWLYKGSSTKIKTGRQIAAMRIAHRNKRRYAARKLWQWHRAGCPSDDDPPWNYIAADGDLFAYEPYWYRNPGGMYPSRSPLKPGDTYPIEGRPDIELDVDDDEADRYELLVPESVYHDDVMEEIRKVANAHNQIAIIVQGLLDRSTCLHPHPPWKLWTNDGFSQGIELVYDVARGLTDGPAIDFDTYRAQLNKSIRRGCYTIGQYRAWKSWMEDRFGSKWKEYAPGGWGNPGPGVIARVHRVLRNGDCEFRWTRERARGRWVQNTERPGWLKKDWSPITVKWICPRDKLTCIDAYTPGDYRMFFDDPRTREQYVRWAPLLLSAENWHARRRQAEDEVRAETGKATKKRARRKSRKTSGARGYRGVASVSAAPVGLAGFAEAVEKRLAEDEDGTYDDCDGPEVNDDDDE